MSPTPTTGIAYESFNVMLNTMYQGNAPAYLPLEACFEYHWDYNKNMGQATIKSINGTEINLSMFPLGISGQLDFMRSDRYWVTVGDTKFFAYRTLLDMLPAADPYSTDPKTTFKSAALMLGEEGDDIVTTPNWGHGGDSGSN